jgi:hypothetical protein
MTDNNNRESMSFHCAHLGADGVAASFDGSWRNWGQIDSEGIRPSGEQVYNLFAALGLAAAPMASPVEFDNAYTGGRQTVPGIKHIYSGANGAHFGIVGENFPQLSHYETMKEAIGLLPESTVPSRLISFDNGARCALQVFCGIQSAAGRNHGGWISLYNGLDGKTPLSYGVSLYSPVCSNTFAKFKGDLTQSKKHTKNFGSALTVIRANLETAYSEAMEAIRQYDSMHSITVTSEAQAAFLDSLFPLGKTDASKNRREEFAVALGQTLAEVPNDSTRVSAYDLFAGVTRYVANREQNRNGESQFEYVTMGPGAQMIDKAYSFLNSL